MFSRVGWTADTEHPSAAAASTSCWRSTPPWRAAADVQVVADQVQERLAADEVAGTVQGVAVPARLALLDEREHPASGPAAAA